MLVSTVMCNHETKRKIPNCTKHKKLMISRNIVFKHKRPFLEFVYSSNTTNPPNIPKIFPRRLDKTESPHMYLHKIGSLLLARSRNHNFIHQIHIPVPVSHSSARDFYDTKSATIFKDVVTVQIDEQLKYLQSKTEGTPLLEI